ncbi:MAG: GNAT family N-acetyltransferase [Betaproteobacteria bacterium]|nr:GNAT family N-acetyltransferase [Betaproteobacteria bacterium]
MTEQQDRLRAFAQLAKIASSHGPLYFEPVCTDDPRWLSLLAASDNPPVGYAPLHLRYQHAYFASAFADYAALDSLIHWEGKPVGLWPLAFVGEAGKARLSSQINGLAGVIAPWFSRHLPEKTTKAAARQWLALLGEAGEALDVPSLRLLGPDTGINLPVWQRLAMEHGAQAGATHRCVIDLEMPAATYHGQLRKSYKALINTARRLWQVRIDETGDAAAFAAFEGLHLTVAGRRTRPELTWQLQREAIVAGDAFVVYLHDAEQRLVGASLFNCSRSEVSYAVGVYDRQLFDKPLAHLSLACAIEHARQRGARSFLLGERPYPGDTPMPNDKELQIAYFKEGFATGLERVPALSIPPSALCGLVAGCTGGTARS